MTPPNPAEFGMADAASLRLMQRQAFDLQSLKNRVDAIAPQVVPGPGTDGQRLMCGGPGVAASWQDGPACFAHSVLNPPLNSGGGGITGATANVFQVVAFEAERFDTASMHSTSSNMSRVILTKAGNYTIGGTITFGSALYAAGTCNLEIVLNGSTVLASVGIPTPAATVQPIVQISTTYRTAATSDYIELWAKHTATNFSIAGDGSSTYFNNLWAAWINP